MNVLLRELEQERLMLQGNLNRMVLTEDKRELVAMTEWAEKRVRRISSLLMQVLETKEANSGDNQAH